MKTYEEVAKSVFEKSEKYLEEKARKAKHIKTAATAMGCFCLAAVLVVAGVAALNSNLTEYPLAGMAENQNTIDEGVAIIAEETSIATSIEAFTSMPEAWTDESGLLVHPPATEPERPQIISGLNVPYFLAFDGALYVSHHSEEGTYFDSTGLYTYLGEFYACEVYQVRGKPDHIGVKIGLGTHEYKKLFDCDFDIGGQKYQIAYRALKDIDYAFGDMVLQTEDFTVYEAIRLQDGVPIETGDSNLQELAPLQEDEPLSKLKSKVYIVDLLPVLKREMPDQFSGDRFSGDDAYYGDAWWIALSNNDIPDETPQDGSNSVSPDSGIPVEPSMPLNTLTGVAPKDTDRILTEVQAVYSDDYYFVFVLAEKGNEIYSLTDGVVAIAGWYNLFGRTIFVETTDGTYIMYCILDEISVKKGDTVTEGQVIGLAGATGYAAYPGAMYAMTDSLPVPEEEMVIIGDDDYDLLELKYGATFLYPDGEERVVFKKENDKILSLTDGEVVWTDYNDNAEYTLCVKSSKGRYICYTHLRSLTVKKGDTVKKDQHIGYPGNTDFTETIFDCGVGYILTDTPPNDPSIQTNTGDTHHDDETHHGDNGTHHG